MKRILTMGLAILLASATIITLSAGDVKRPGGSRDMVEELYDQAAKQRDDLEEIEESIEKFHRKKYEALEKYNSYIAYNNRYYTDAKARAATISDPAVKQKANDLLGKSEGRYKANLAEWENNIASMNNKERELSDLHSLLELMVTEPIIAKYQGSNKPDISKLKEANTDLQSVIERIKVLTK